jgi:hypothetical protein
VSYNKSDNIALFSETFNINVIARKKDIMYVIFEIFIFHETSNFQEAELLAKRTVDLGNLVNKYNSFQ